MNLRSFLSKLKFLKEIFYTIQEINISYLKTLYVNFSCLPIKYAIKFPIIVYQGTQLEQIGKITFNCPIKKGTLVIGKRMFFRNQKTTFINRGELEINGNCEIMGGTLIHILKNNSKLTIGNNVMIGECTKILTETHTTIGDYTRIAFNNLLIDSEFHYIINIKTGDINIARNPIKIGAYNWIGNSCVIKKGTITPDNIIVSNGSMLTKNYSDVPQYSILMGTPAKIKVSDVRRIYNLKYENFLTDMFIQNPNLKVYNVEKDFNDIIYDRICHENINVHIH